MSCRKKKKEWKRRVLVILEVDVTGDSQEALDRGVAAVRHGCLRPEIEAYSTGVDGSYSARSLPYV